MGRLLAFSFGDVCVMNDPWIEIFRNEDLAMHTGTYKYVGVSLAYVLYRRYSQYRY
jgi:hypothetical protein